METKMKLYHLPGCPYCARAINKIDELNIREHIDFIEVPRAHEERTELAALTNGIVGVPTLIDGTTIIADDDDKIIVYLGEKFKIK